MFPRTQYLNKLIQHKDNGRVKIITGLRRCGKSYLLSNIYTDYLLNEGIPQNHIISVSLDTLENAKYRNPLELNTYVREQIQDSSDRYYIFIDEIQFVTEIQNPYVNSPDAKINFVDVVLGLMQIKNADIYITGSNSHMLSSDILTQFRDRGDEIRINPLSYSEFYESYEGDKRSAWQDYYTYGGMPAAIAMSTHEEKSKYLRDLLTRTYIKDILERHDIRNESDKLEILLDILASGIGSYTNPSKISSTFKSNGNTSISANTVNTYISYFTDAYLLQKAGRYDIKGRKYINSLAKYYYPDPGLRNAKLGFRQIEETHLMENIIYNDLKRRGMDVDVGVVEHNGKDENGKSFRKQLEVDFVVNRGSERVYIQSALNIDDPEKKESEIASLVKIPDSFRKIVIVKDYKKPWIDDHGIQYIGIEPFLLDENFI